MARIVTYDPGTSEIRSPLIAGLTEACNKLSGILDMQTDTFNNVELQELQITDEDRYRIYQIANGRRLWLQSPMPIIKKNGEQITESNDGFSIDYIGGSIAFEPGYTLTENDHITVSATYIKDSSNKLSTILTEIAGLTETAGHYKGYFETATTLAETLITGVDGDYALVGADSSFYIWDSKKSIWISSQASIDVTQFYDKSQIDELLEGKENALLTNELAEEDKGKYYLAANKTWQHFSTQVLGTVLTDLDTTTKEKITALDTVLSAFGKLQAQLDNNIGGVSGYGAPTTETAGVVGQDYINISNGDKYYLVSIAEKENGTKEYIWEQYAKKSDTPTNVITIDDGANMILPQNYGSGPHTLEVVDEEDFKIVIDDVLTENSKNAVSSGAVYAALQTKANKDIAFNIMLLSDAWTDNKQTVTNENFTTSNDYGFFISPVGRDYREYTENNIFLLNMSDGSAIFECDTTPTNSLTLNIIRTEVSTGTSEEPDNPPSTPSNVISIVPSQSGTLTFDWNHVDAYVPDWNNYDSSKLTIGGTTSSGGNSGLPTIGTLTATFTPKEGYVWFDGSTSTKEVGWVIEPMLLPVPIQARTRTASGYTLYIENDFDNVDLQKVLQNTFSDEWSGTFTTKQAGTFPQTINTPLFIWGTNRSNAISSVSFNWVVH